MSGLSQVGAAVQGGTFRFEGLPFYTREEVGLWNWCRLHTRGAPDWTGWMRDAWGELLEAPAGTEICLTQRNTIDASAQPRTHSFQLSEIRIGREEDNEIVLSTRSVGKRHARLFFEDGACFVEDLGSSLGTYLNQQKLAPQAPLPVASGDTIAIFPHNFTVSLRNLWARQDNIAVYPASVDPMTWQGFLNTSGLGRTSFAIDVHPVRSSFCLEAGRAFLSEFVERMLRPLELPARRSAPSAADGGLVEFIILCLLERVNRDLAFPFQFETGACGSKPQFEPDTPGVALTWSVNLLELTGALRVFAPYALMEAMRQTGASCAASALPAPVSWRFPVSLGHVGLSFSEISSLEPDDVVLFAPDLRLQFPGDPERGWHATALGADGTVFPVTDASNLARIRIDKPFERGPLDAENAQTAERPRTGRPDLGGLPLKLHVILSEKELTLAEANMLASGTILELDNDKSGAVSLAINGKILGDGQLVEIEGRLGVKILAWKGA